MAAHMLRTNCRYFKIYAHVRHYSDNVRRPTFIGRVIDNLRQEMAKNKEMKENLRKFREEAAKLENTEALKKAREKFQAVESEASKGGDALKEKIGVLKDKVRGVLSDAQKSELIKKAGELTEDLGKTAKGATDSILETSQKLSKTAPYKTLAQTADAVKKEIPLAGANVYRSPLHLRKRKQCINEGPNLKTVDVNTDATGIELHKDSKFYQSWQNFKDNNPYVNKILDWKSKYDESDNPLLRASRAVTERVVDIMGGLFQKTDMSEALTEICKMDPDFTKEDFIKICEKDIIPNVLEAMIRGDLEVLKDWCHEAPYNVLSTPIKQAFSQGYSLDCRVIDIDSVDLAMGKVMEQGPILVVTFTAQQIMCVRDKLGGIVEGDPNKIMRINYVWVLCRDPSELDPKAAWRLMDLSANSSEQLI